MSAAPRVLTEAERTTTAYHEAGHCVAAELFGLPVAAVWVYRQPRWRPGAGWMIGGTELASGTPAAPLLRSVGLLAGALAEREARIRKGLPPAPAVDASLDRAMVESELRDFRPALPMPAGTATAQAREWAAQVVAERWRTIEAIADALLRDGRLTGNEVRAIIARTR